MRKLFVIVMFMVMAHTSFAVTMPTGKIAFDDATGLTKDVTASDPLPVNIGAGAISVSANVTQDLLGGILGTATLSIPAESAVALPSAPASATSCLIMPTQDVNWGSTTVSSGTAHQYFFQSIPGQGFFKTSAFTGFRLVGRTAVATATIIWR